MYSSLKNDSMKKLLPLLFITGAILLLAGVVLYMPYRDLTPYLYLPGATLIAIAQVNNLYKGTNFVLKRLYRQQMFGSFFLLMAGILMVTTHGNEWIAALTIGTFIELYTAFRIPGEEKKEKEE